MAPRRPCRMGARPCASAPWGWSSAARWVWGPGFRVPLGWWEKMGDGMGEGLGAWASSRERLGGVGQQDVRGRSVTLSSPHNVVTTHHFRECGH